MSGETILVVDDSHHTREFIVDYVLKPKGYLAILAVDGAEGVQSGAGTTPRSDHPRRGTAQLDGMDVLHALKANGLNIPVIMSTAHGSEQIADRSVPAGRARLRAQAV